MSETPLATVSLASGPEAALERLPKAAGVGQILGPDERNLVLGTAANLRRWAAGHLGRGPRPAAGKRPKTDLSRIATAVRFALSRGGFHQRLVYERLMAPLVPLDKRRDLRRPAFLHLDPAERFPRMTVAATDENPSGLFGPFRDRRAAERTRDAVQRLFPLRPCDLRFEPDERLAVGIACLYAQVRSCAAPCLGRLSEPDYRALAERAARWLADASERGEAAALVPEVVGAVQGSRLLIVDPGRGGAIGLYPVRDGRVLDGSVRETREAALDEALDSLEWPAARGPSDWPWLLAWLRGATARSRCVVLSRHDRGELGARVRAALERRTPVAMVR